MGCHISSHKNTSEKNSFCGGLVFGLLSDVIQTGNERPLEEDDLTFLDCEDTRCLTERLQQEWENEMKIKRECDSKPHLWRALLRATDNKLMAVILLLSVLASFCRLIQPVVLSFLLEEMTANSSDTSWGILILYSVLLSTSSFVQLFACHHASYAEFLMSVQSKASLIGLVYKKIMTTKHHNLAEISSGHVVNLISKDLIPVQKAINCLDSLLVPVEILGVFCLLWNLIGWQTFGGAVFSIFLIAYQTFLGQVFKVLQGKVANLTDGRLRLICDVISGIRVLKINAWEWCYRDLVSLIRRSELNVVFKKGAILAGYASGYSCYPVLASFISLFPLFTAGNPLTVQNVFTTLALLGVLHKPVTIQFAYEMRSLFQGMSSLERMESFLLADNETESESILISFTERIKSKSDSDIMSQSYLSFKNKLKTPQFEGGGDNVKEGNDSWQQTDSGDVHPQSYSAKLSKELQTMKPVLSLSCHELYLASHVCPQGRPFLCFDNVHYYPHEHSSNINICISDSSLLAITGPVGCGKTTLFDIIIGEIPPTSGRISHQGSIAYVCQTPWVFSGTVRQNILFGKEYSHSAYEKTIKVCSLKEDLTMFPVGDMTHVGERGVSLSGGQRARVNLARAVYADADIYLLDDPLSALDMNVSKEIFDRCICDVLSDRIRVIITHNPYCLQRADLIFLMNKEGKITQGTYKEICDSEILSEISSFTSAVKANQTSFTNTLAQWTAESDEASNSNGVETELEDRMIGSVSYLTYWKYFTYGMSNIVMVTMAILLFLPEGTLLASSFWLARWTNLSWRDQQDALNADIYVALAAACFVFALARSYLSIHALINCSSKLHTVMLTSLLKASVRFFDVNPAGRILNRFAKDVGCMDEVLPYGLLEAVQYVMFTISVLVLVSIANFWVIAASVPFTILSLYFCKRQIRAAREIKRIEAITCSPVCAHVVDTIQGITTVRVYKRQEQFMDKLYSYQDRNSKAWFCYCACLKWVGVRLDLLSSVLVTIVTFAAIFLSSNAALSGLSISYCLQLSTTVQWMLQAVGEAENNMTSVERVLTYAQLDSEPGYNTTSHAPRGWPEKGSVTFKDVALCYYQGGPTVLNGISFSVLPGEKIGIVGRTGAGKSSLFSCLLRLPPNTAGAITIDGINVEKLNVQEARSAIAVIPQHPFLFNDTLRRNLDPSEKFADDDLWRMLEKVELKTKVEQRPGQLYCHVTEHGANFSVGERQLICFARALLFGRKIILMDEATSSVDSQTDELIRRIIDREMHQCTVMTIAHRLSAVMEYDRIMVLDEGKVIEMDSPNVLLSNKFSYFYKLLYGVQ